MVLGSINYYENGFNLLPASNFGKDIYSISISLSHIGAASSTLHIYLGLELICL